MAPHSNRIAAQPHRGAAPERQLGLGSYKSAWLWCAKLRRSMVAGDRSPLAGLVEIDKTEIVCRSKNNPLTGGHGRSRQGKILRVGAGEVAAGPGRIRLQQVSDYSADSLHPFLKANPAPGTPAKTNGWAGYSGAPGVIYDPHVAGGMAAHIVLPWTHRVFQSQALGARPPSRPAAQTSPDLP